MLTISDIRNLDPCYDPTKYISEDWQGTIIDILEMTEVPAKDRLWVALRNDFMSDTNLRLFAIWCARTTDLNDICKNTCNIAEKFALGIANHSELSAARSAAWSAAGSAAGLAAWSAGSAAVSAAGLAARSAAESAARSAAWSAAGSAAGLAARSAAGLAQVEKLIIFFKSGNQIFN